MKIKKKSCSKVISTRIVLGLAKNATCNGICLRVINRLRFCMSQILEQQMKTTTFWKINHFLCPTVLFVTFSYAYITYLLMKNIWKRLFEKKSGFLHYWHFHSFILGNREDSNHGILYSCLLQCSRVFFQPYMYVTIRRFKTAILDLF